LADIFGSATFMMMVAGGVFGAPLVAEAQQTVEIGVIEACW